MKKLVKNDFTSAINTLLSEDGVNGVIYQPISTLDDGRDLCIVFGWCEGYADGNEDYQRDGYTLCAKLAINIDDLQCDYDIDWYMPWDDEGNVYDTDMALSKDFDDADWYNQQAEVITKALNAGQLECK